MKKELLEKITDLHDVGKKVATKKNIKGNYTSYNHDKIDEKIVNDIQFNTILIIQNEKKYKMVFTYI